MNTENEIYTLATCPGTKYSGDTITLKATPRDGIGPYYVAFKKDGIIIDSSRLGAQPNPILNATEDVEITRTYTLNDEDVRNALTGTIGFSVFIRGSCPTGGGLQFDGVNKYVDAGNAASLNMDYITMEAWIKPTIKNLQIIVQDRDSVGYRLLLAIDNNSKVYFKIYPDSNPNATSLNSVILNSWNHVVTTFDGTTGKIYLNGIQDPNTFSYSGVIATQTSYGFLIGKAAIFSQFSGSIDEVRIYNRALSPTEILDLYNGSTPRDASNIYTV